MLGLKKEGRAKMEISLIIVASVIGSFGLFLLIIGLVSRHYYKKIKHNQMLENAKKCPYYIERENDER